jgi:peptide/nickel transport system substrate-binding protein
MRTNRTLLGLFALALLTAATAGCPNRQKKTRPQTLVIHADSEPAHLINMLQPDAWAHRITSHNLFESLTRLDPRSYKPRGELASTWKVSADKLTYTFYLRQGVTWHDGKPFSGRDVKFTFDRLMDENVRAANARGTLEPFIAHYELVKPDEFRIVCKRVSPWFLTNISDLAILPEHLMARGDLNTHKLLRRPVGTGPYRFISWRSGRQITLERYPGYWGAKPKIKRLVYLFIRDPDKAVKLARRREIDFLPRVRAAHWFGKVKKDPFFRHEFITTRHYSPGTSYILLNHGSEGKPSPFGDVRVRRALAKLLDLRRITDKILQRMAKPVGSLFWIKDPNYDQSIKPMAFDPVGARKLLAAAGYTPSGGDKTLIRDGKPLRFKFLLVTSSTSSKRWLTLYQEELRKAGVVMELSPIDWSTYVSRIRAHDFDAGALGMVQVGPFTDLYYQLHSSQAKDGQNYGQYSNPHVDQLLEQIRSSMDDSARRRMSHKLQQILSRDVAMIPLFAMEDRGIVARRVHGVYSSALWYQVRDWWLD